VPDPDGHPTSRLVLLTDVSYRKKIEDALREGEKEFHSLAEAMPQIVWVTRPDAGYLYQSAMAGLYGLTPEETSAWLEQAFHPDDQQRAWEAGKTRRKTAPDYSLESRLRRAIVYRWFLIRGAPPMTKPGHP